MNGTHGDMPEPLQEQFCATLDSMTKSIADTRKSIKDLLEKSGTDAMDVKEGISLLSLKHQVMLWYLHSLTLLSSQRVLGNSLKKRAPPSASFQDPNRGARGADAGDLVDSLIESRVVLEKSKALEGRMRYQIEKLMRSATEPVASDDIEDPLSFKPNPGNMIADEKETRAQSEDTQPDDIYRPPKVAPMPYNETSGKEKRRARVPAALASLEYQTGSDPYLESTSGLGGAGNRGLTSTSARARELAKMNEYEESHMTRLVLSKKEAKRRRLDEENIALGGTGLGSHFGRGRARGAGLADEFGDLLRSREPRAGLADEYEDLRARSKKKDAFERSKARKLPDQDDVEEARPRKRTKFHQEIKKSKKRQR